ncbi:MAG: hypothetical protein F6K21_05615 [Symploca sp. SIO2D2]|nr:hypothetical protein [Symploca sp. SIO2D2]
MVRRKPATIPCASINRNGTASMAAMVLHETGRIQGVGKNRSDGSTILRSSAECSSICLVVLPMVETEKLK